MIFRLFRVFIENLLRYIDGPIGVKLRYSYYKNRLGACGKNIIIDTGVFILSPKHVFLKDNIWIDKNVIILAGTSADKRTIKFKDNPKYLFNVGELHIDAEVHIAPNVILQSHGGISVGKRVGIAAGSNLYSLSHHYRNLLNKTDLKKYFFTPMAPAEDQSMISSPIVISDGSAIGLNTVVLPGTVVPKNSWFGVGLTLAGSSYEEDKIYYNTSELASKDRV